MSEENTAFLEKIKHLSVEELIKYELAALRLARLINVIGIFGILIMLIYPLLPILFLGTPVIGLLAVMETGINRSIVIIRELLLNPKKSR